MKKVLVAIFASLLFVFPVFAEETKEIYLNDYTTLGLNATLDSEEMEKEYSNYSEKDDQAVIYMFRGQGCGYCKSFLTFLNSITDEYGKYFKLVSFETWYNEDNSKLLQTISEFAGNPAQGVPYIIIGEHIFPGYASDYDDQIKSAITELYESNEKYDIFDAYNASIKATEKESSSAMNKVIIWNLVFTTLSTVIIVFVIVSTNSKKCNCQDVEKQYSRAEETPISLEEDDDFDDEDFEEKAKPKTSKKVSHKSKKSNQRKNNKK